MIFVDTNYFLSFLLDRISSQTKIVNELFGKAATNDIEIFTSLVVVFEVYWVLARFYNKNPREAANLISQILDLAFIKVQEKETLIGAIELAKNSKLGFYDSFNLLYAKKYNAQDFRTFDIKLQKAFKKKI